MAFIVNNPNNNENINQNPDKGSQFNPYNQQGPYTVNNGNNTSSIVGNNRLTLQDAKNSELSINHIYSPQEIIRFRLNEAIQNHPFARKPAYSRSKLAYKDIMGNLHPTNRYLLPGQIVLFEYLEPKYKEELEYYDRTPLTLFIGITRLPNGNVREIGLNLHYYPPYTRLRILNKVYSLFKPYFDKYFNEAPQKPNLYINWQVMKRIMKISDKIAFGIKMYIPTLRSRSYVIPTKAIPTAFYTEGNFSKATLGQIMTFWRQFQ